MFPLTILYYIGVGRHLKTVLHYSAQEKGFQDRDFNKINSIFTSSKRRKCKKLYEDELQKYGGKGAGGKSKSFSKYFKPLKHRMLRHILIWKSLHIRHFVNTLYKASLL